ncbi:MAG: cytochrome c biogenesis protein CcdA [Armatimonas sp.]
MGEFLTTAFLAGLVALLTPCVFPMIPVTLAFFTKQATNKDGQVNSGGVVRLALLYCLGIIAAFVLIGVGISATVGASGAYRFATHPLTNLGFATLFVIFGLAMLEVFNLDLPPALQGLAGGRRSGTLGVLVMGLTFVVTAFTCTAPFVGSVLILASKATGAQALLKPVAGMAVFALALSLPFFILALFPPLLAKLPRSGAWLSTVKGAMGFLEIAAALKFLSNTDLVWGWGVLSREVFLGLTALTLTVAGLWLLGRLKLGHATPSVEAPPLRKLWAGLFIAFAVYCLYGIRGHMDRLMETYVPPYRLGAKADAPIKGELVWIRNLEEGKALAQKEGRRVLIDFTGHTCVNCRDVETNVFTKAPVQEQLRKFSLVRLYVDPGKMDGIVTSEEQATKNYDYEDKAFGALTQPLYGVIEPDGTIVAKTDYTVAKSVDGMAAWLEKQAK